MFNDKKRSDLSSESDLSDLPELPQIRPNMNKENNLPTFPDMPSSQKLNEITIKNVATPSFDLPDIPETIKPSQFPENNKFKALEMEEWHPDSPDIEETKITKFKPLPIHKPERNPEQDIFIKIEKFRSVRKALSDTHDKLEEIDSLLQRIRETKMREEQELEAWEKEISAAKARIKEIVSNIFEKVE